MAAGSDETKAAEENDQKEQIPEDMFFDKKTFYLLGFIILASAVAWYLGKISSHAAIAATLFAYLPSYLSGIQHKGGPTKCLGRKSVLHRYVANKVDFKYNLWGCSQKDFKNVNQAIFVIVPHGLASVGHLLFGLGDTHDFFESVCKVERRSLGASIVFVIPGFREFMLSVGGIDASRESAETALKKGYSLTIIPGGVVGQSLTRYGEAGAYLRNRKGFVKLAIKHGIPLIPVYIFGETLVYKDIPFFRPVAKFLATKLRIGIPPLLGDFGILPMKPAKGMVAVVGKPVQVSKKVETSPDWDSAVKQAHGKISKSISAIFEANKTSYGYADKKLYDFADEVGERKKEKQKTKKRN
ncbi:hypothetical protein AAMO2058_000460800 [Amorphochlora amoebiformis]